MFGQGAGRNPSSIHGRYPSRTRSVPPAAAPEPKRQEKTPETKQEQSTAADSAQPVPQPPKQEESRAPAPLKEPQAISPASQNESRGRKIIPLKDGFPDDEIPRQKSLQEEIKDDISNLTRRLAELHGQQRIVASREDAAATVVTLAGENRGASMDLGKQETAQVRRGNEETESAESKGKSASEGNPVHAYVNSNVQGANNSILYNSSCPQRNPGVHLAVSNNPVSSFRRMEAGPAYPDGKTASGGLEMSRAVQAAPAPNQRTVKRRCLRALFLESDPETDSQKPVRHGCRHQCHGNREDAQGKEVSMVAHPNSHK